MIRWLVDESKYYENMPEDENEVSSFTFTVAKDKMIVRCEAQNEKDIDTRTAYVTTFPQGTVQIYMYQFLSLMITETVDLG